MKPIQQAIEMSRKEEEERKAKEGGPDAEDPQNEVIQAKSTTETPVTT